MAFFQLPNGGKIGLREVLTIGLFANLALVGLVDVYIVAVHGKESSITYLIHNMSKEWPAIPLGVGLLIGHLFL